MQAYERLSWLFIRLEWQINLRPAASNACSTGTSSSKNVSNDEEIFSIAVTVEFYKYNIFTNTLENKLNLSKEWFTASNCMFPLYFNYFSTKYTKYIFNSFMFDFCLSVTATFTFGTLPWIPLSAKLHYSVADQGLPVGGRQVHKGGLDSQCSNILKELYVKLKKSGPWAVLLVPPLDPPMLLIGGSRGHTQCMSSPKEPDSFV